MIEHQMHALRLRALGDPASPAYEQISTPRPGPLEVLVQVHAALEERAGGRQDLQGDDELKRTSGA